MKKITILLIIAFFTISCKDSVKSVMNQKNDEDSFIKSLENNGEILAKKEIIIFDLQKKNSIKVLFAAKTNDELNNYLKDFTITLLVTKEIPILEPFKESSIPNNQGNLIQEKSNTQINIYSEIQEKNFENGMRTYTLKFDRNLISKSKSKKSKINAAGGWTYNSWCKSALFDDFMKVTRNSTGSTTLENSLLVQFEHHNCGFCSWSDGTNHNLYEGGPSEAMYNVDARRLGAYISHNYGNFNVVFGNY